MSLVASLNVGVSALRSFSEGIQVISNNISNVSTVAYKSSHANYSDTFSNLLRPLVPNERGDVGAKINPTQIGGGVQVQSVTAAFSQGTVTNTGATSDLAIAGPGYFRVKDPVSGTSYVTRAGNFRFDANGYLVTQQGHRVQGTNGASTKVAYNPATGDYDVKTSSSNPVTVSAVRASANPNVLQGVDTTGLSKGMVVYSAYTVAPFGATLVKGSTSATLNLTTTNLNRIQVGQPFTGPGVPAGTYIKAHTAGSSTVTLSQAADASSSSSDLFTIPAWDTTGAASGANNHAVITNISGSTVTLSNMDGVNVYDQPLSFTFMTPKTVKLSVTNLSAVTVPAGQQASVQAVSYGLTNVVAGSKTATVSAADAASLKAGLTVVATHFPVGTTVVGITSTGGATETVTFSDPANTGAASTDTVTQTSYDGAILTGLDLSLSGITSGAKSANIADASAAQLQVGMTVKTAKFPAGARITAIGATGSGGAGLTTVTLSENAVASGSDVITGVSQRMYSVDLNDTSAVVDGMVAKVTDPMTQAVSYAGVTVDRSSPTPRVLLNFASFGDGIADPATGNNGDPITSDFTGAFSVDFETNSSQAYYSAASAIGDVRIAFDEGKDFNLVDINGGALASNWLSKAQQNAPKVKSFTVGTGGSILATLSNGQTFVTGQVLLQGFLDPGALIREGDNLFSGMDLAGERNSVKWNNMTIDKIDQVSAGKSGLGVIQGSALELSNVDIAEEFAQMITTQRSFQAGSRVISVSDQMLEEVVNLKR